MHYSSGQTVLQITPNYNYKHVCALESPSPNPVCSGEQSCSLLASSSCLSQSAQLHVFPNSCHPCSLMGTALKLPDRLSLATRALQSSCLVYQVSTPLAYVFWLLRMSILHCGNPSPFQYIFQPHNESCFFLRLP